MHLIEKSRNVLRRILQSWGSPWVKRRLWNKEFSQGRWDSLDATPGDCVYRYVEKYSQDGDILDLGCGSGNTGNELNGSTYRSYTGVDISDIAIQKAIARSAKNGRSAKNRYLQSDITTYLPHGVYRVILFRESLNYIPRTNINGMLKRFRKHLDERGVFVVRLYDRNKYKEILAMIRANFHVLEEFSCKDLSTAVLVFR
jgi:SAM-dependent methyltransferase